MSDQIEYAEIRLSDGDGNDYINFYVDGVTHSYLLEEVYELLNSKMPCGHLARYAVNGEEGTQYCSMCEKEHWQKLGEIKALQELCNEIDASVYPETWGYIFQKMEDLKGYQS